MTAYSLKEVISENIDKILFSIEKNRSKRDFLPIIALVVSGLSVVITGLSSYYSYQVSIDTAKLDKQIKQKDYLELVTSGDSYTIRLGILKLYQLGFYEELPDIIVQAGGVDGIEILQKISNENKVTHPNISKNADLAISAVDLVAKLQESLNIDIDGIFGNYTIKALDEYKKNNNITNDSPLSMYHGRFYLGNESAKKLNIDPKLFNADVCNVSPAC